MTIASERYLAVCQPFKHNNFTKSRVTMVFVLIYLMGVVCTAGAAFQVLSLPCLHSPYSTGLTKCHSVYSDKQFQKSTIFLKTVYYIMLKIFEYRSGTLNSDTANSKFHLIQSFCNFLPDSYHLMFKLHG